MVPTCQDGDAVAELTFWVVVDMTSVEGLHLFECAIDYLVHSCRDSRNNDNDDDDDDFDDYRVPPPDTSVRIAFILNTNNSNNNNNNPFSNAFTHLLSSHYPNYLRTLHAVSVLSQTILTHYDTPTQRVKHLYTALTQVLEPFINDDNEIHKIIHTQPHAQTDNIAQTILHLQPGQNAIIIQGRVVHIPFTPHTRVHTGIEQQAPNANTITHAHTPPLHWRDFELLALHTQRTLNTNKIVNLLDYSAFDDEVVDPDMITSLMMSECVCRIGLLLHTRLRDVGAGGSRTMNGVCVCVCVLCFRVVCCVYRDMCIVCVYMCVCVAVVSLCSNSLLCVSVCVCMYVDRWDDDEWCECSVRTSRVWCSCEWWW